MNISSIIIVITFLAALVEKFSHKPRLERKGIWKKLKLENIALLLLGILLVTQLVENFYISKKEVLQDEKSNETHKSIISTKEKVANANKLIDSILLNLKKEIDYTKKEFELILSLNEEMKEARKNISKSISEYQELNSKYSEQLNLEREKILNAKPDVRIILPKSTIDSTFVSYQFQLINYGRRVADSLEFYSIMVLTDSTNFQIKKVTELKSNFNNQNLLSLPPNQGHSYVANSRITTIDEIEKFGKGYLLVYYSYYDLMTDSKIAAPVSIFVNNSFKDINQQYGNNIKTSAVERMKRYFLINNPEIHDIFFKK